MKTALDELAFELEGLALRKSFLEEEEKNVNAELKCTTKKASDICEKIVKDVFTDDYKPLFESLSKLCEYGFVVNSILIYSDSEVGGAMISYRNVVDVRIEFIYEQGKAIINGVNIDNYD